LAAFVTSMGIYVIRRFEKWGPKNSIYFICFAAGVLISVSFCLYRSGTNQSHRDACIIPVYWPN
jgi:hypothetical protein